MKLAIISDVHDHVWNLRAALAALSDTDALLVAGDLCSPFVLPILARDYPHGPVHVVFGNNDGDRYRMTRVAASFEHVHLHGEVFEAELGGRSVVMNHFPELARPMDARRFDAIVFGHDHRFGVERDGRAWRLNPGTLLGYDPGEADDVAPTFLIYDTRENDVRGFELRREHGEVRAVAREAASQGMP